MPSDSESQKINSKHLPPSPLDLAILAALLKKEASPESRRQAPPNDVYSIRPWESMIQAARFYMQAATIYEGLSEMSIEDRVLLFGGSRRQELISDIGHIFDGKNWNSSKESYILYDDAAMKDGKYDYDFKMIGGLDPARKYIHRKASYLKWKQSSTIQRNLFRFFQYHAKQHNDKNASIIAGFELAVSRIATQMGLPEKVVLDWRFFGDWRRSWSGEELYRKFMIHIAVRAEPSEKGNPSKPPQSSIVGFLLTADVLDALVNWRGEQRRKRGATEEK